MAFLSLVKIRDQNRCGQKFPSDAIVYRTKAEKYNGQNKIMILFRIPRQISTKASIDVGTEVDVLYNPEHKAVKIKVLKNTGGFSVKGAANKSKYPQKAVILNIRYFKESLLPITNEAIYIRKYEVSDGLNFKLEIK